MERRLEIVRRASDRDVMAYAMGERIRELRHRLGLRQEDLAARIGIARPNLARLEAGRHLPTTSTLRRVADALGCRTEDLLAMPGESHADEDRELSEGGVADWREALDREDSDS
ncbi:MAG TPA: helix-turn-helix transcriptional regulator [Planctomycetota bacterium]|nr:helix-turn-helix transcriptional regulator [Planctomycetota bacterium]